MKYTIVEINGYTKTDAFMGFGEGNKTLCGCTAKGSGGLVG